MSGLPPESRNVIPASPSPGWGSALGFLDFNVARPETQRDALAIHEITERVYRYGWSFDEHRADLLADCFTLNATWSGNIGGLEPLVVRQGRDGIVEWLCGFWAGQSDQRRHNMTSVSVAVESDHRAVVHSSLLLTSANNGSLAIVLTSFYRFKLERAADIWRISSLFEGCDVAF